MNQPQVYICPLSLELLSHLPPHPIPLGCHTAPHLGFLHQTANPTGYYLHMVEYVFQCYSLKPAHPLLPALCSKVCSCICLSTKEAKNNQVVKQFIQWGESKDYVFTNEGGVSTQITGVHSVIQFKQFSHYSVTNVTLTQEDPYTFSRLTTS